jgi:hypothetical protein
MRNATPAFNVIPLGGMRVTAIDNGVKICSHVFCFLAFGIGGLVAAIVKENNQENARGTIWAGPQDTDAGWQIPALFCGPVRSPPCG